MCVHVLCIWLWHHVAEVFGHIVKGSVKLKHASVRWTSNAGNNTFGEAVRDELLKMKDSPERSSFILMKRVHPIIYRNYAVAAERPIELVEMVSELGVFGSLVAYVIFLVCWNLFCYFILFNSRLKVVKSFQQLKGNVSHIVKRGDWRYRSVQCHSYEENTKNTLIYK